MRAPWLKGTLAALLLLAAMQAPADALSPEALFLACAGCHEREAGKPHRVGPNLHDLAGRTAGTQPGFAYSPALAASGLRWDTGTLTAWVLAPEAMVPGSWMLYHNILQPGEVTQLVEFLLEPAPAGAAPTDD